MKIRQNGCDAPLRCYLEKVLRDMGRGGISHWAAERAVSMSHEWLRGFLDRVWKRGGLLEKGSFQKSPLSRDFRESPDSGKQRRI